MGNVRLQEVTKTYPNGTLAVHPTSFDIAARPPQKLATLPGTGVLGLRVTPRPQCPTAYL